jgi:hypothetical protein
MELDAEIKATYLIKSSHRILSPAFISTRAKIDQLPVEPGREG